MGEIVSLVRTQDSEEQIRDSVSLALKLINFNSKNAVKSVAIKPNLCYYWNADTGYTTDPRVVAGIIDWIRERYDKDIDIRVVESDATAMQTKYAFRMLGYEKLAKEKDVELFNLSNDYLSEKNVEVNGHDITFKVPQLLLKSDVFINVPKLKVMQATRITCALKNIFGCIGSQKKIAYHPFLNEAIVGINKILHPHLTIVDGMVALGCFPSKLGLMMASADPFSIDWVASQIMGYNPYSVGFIKVAIKEKVWNPKGVLTRGENMEMFKKEFPKDGIFSSILWSTQLKLLKLYIKIVNDVAPSIIEGV